MICGLIFSSVDPHLEVFGTNCTTFTHCTRDQKSSHMCRRARVTLPDASPSTCCTRRSFGPQEEAVQAQRLQACRPVSLLAHIYKYTYTHAPCRGRVAACDVNLVPAAQASSPCMPSWHCTAWLATREIWVNNLPKVVEQKYLRGFFTTTGGPPQEYRINEKERNDQVA